MTDHGLAEVQKGDHPGTSKTGTLINLKESSRSDLI
jgi:hypothetical protein